MNLLPDILKDIEKDLSKEISLNLSNEEIARAIFPYIDKIYREKNYFKNREEMLKKSITPREKEN